MLGLALLVLAAVLLGLGADLFADNAGGLASGLGVTGLAVGLLLAGAEPEELVTGVVASSRDQTRIAAGDAIGANVTMLTIVLGAILLLQPLEATLRVRAYGAAALATGVLAAAFVSGGTLGRVEGTVLVLVYLGFVVGVLTREHRQARGTAAPRPGERPGRVRSGGLAIAGLAVVTLGGWAAVSGAERVVAGFGLSESGVGLTLVAFATSAELLALMWAAHRHEVTELAIAAVVGSVIGNATATLGVSALVRPLDTAGVVRAAWLAAGLTLLLLVPLDSHRTRARFLGALLVASYVAFVAFSLH